MAAIAAAPAAAATDAAVTDAVVVRLLVGDGMLELEFPRGRPSAAELFSTLRSAMDDRLPAEQINRLKIYFRLPHGGQHATGLTASDTTLNWDSYLCIDPHTYVARIATHTPPSSPERPAAGGGGTSASGASAAAAAAGLPKKQSNVSDLCAALQKVALAGDGRDIDIYAHYFYSSYTNTKSKMCYYSLQIRANFVLFSFFFLLFYFLFFIFYFSSLFLISFSPHRACTSSADH